MVILIDKKKLLKDLKGIKDVLSAQGDPFLAAMIQRAIDCVNKQPPAALSYDRKGDVKNGSSL